MNSAYPLLRDVSPRTKPSDSAVASWYTQGQSDGFGDRLLMFDNTGAPTFELLRFRSELAEVPGFERALRSRVDELAQFQHPTFTRVRAVERLDGGEGLALVSTHTPGKRMSEMFQGPRVAGLHPAFATWLVRQITPALAELEREGDDISHGVLSPDRVILTPEGSLVIAEHVLGSALRTLELPAIRLWSDFGVLTPASVADSVSLDRRSDVVQIGLIALSVLLGRRITPADYPQKLDALLDEFAETAARRSPALVPPLRLWLARALGTGEWMFRSAEEARDGLRELPNHAGTTAIGQLPAVREQPIEAAAAEPPPVDSLRTLPTGAAFVEPAMMDEPLASASIDPLVEPPEMHNITHTDHPWDFHAARPEDTSTSAVSRLAEHENPLLAGLALGSRRSIPITAWVAVMLAALSVVEAGIIARLLTHQPVPTTAATLPLVIESPDAGDVVVVDGRPSGVTPLQLAVGSQTHSIRVLSQRPEPVAEIDRRQTAPVVQAAATTPLTPKPAAAVLAARDRSGALRITSPIDIKVLEGDRVLGSSADGPVIAAAGVHEFDLINSEFGFRSHQTVTIKPGEVSALSVAPPDGQVSVNASPWAQVLIDGNPAGDTPLANVSVPAGRHEITFRHPQLGERRESVVVRSGALTRVSASLGR